MNSEKSLSIESSLQVYFFDCLSDLNQKMISPVAPEIIFYSSKIMDKFGDPSKLFEEREGRISQKVLGTKFLEASRLEMNKRKRLLKDVADTALFVSGFFSDSLNKKIIDVSYYEDLGKTAYSTLDNYVPSVYDLSSFYKQLSRNFSAITSMMNIISNSVFKSQDDHILIISNKAS